LDVRTRDNALLDVLLQQGRADRGGLGRRKDFCFFRELVGGIPWVILYSLKDKGAQENWKVSKVHFPQA